MVVPTSLLFIYLFVVLSFIWHDFLFYFYSIPVESVKPHIEPLLVNLFAAIELSGSEENEYVMKGEYFKSFCFIIKALDTFGNIYIRIKNLLGNERWRAVASIKHCEKRLPLK